MPKVFIGLGSNLENPINQIKMAITALHGLPSTYVQSISSLYRSLPWGEITDQPDFVNAVVRLKTDLAPLELLEQLQQIEKQQNRIKIERNGPRTIDCDILLFEGGQLNSPLLTIPHLYLEQRAFVVIPLAEIAPELLLPNGVSIQTLAEAVDHQGLTKVVEEACP